MQQMGWWSNTKKACWQLQNEHLKENIYSEENEDLRLGVAHYKPEYPDSDL